MPNPYGLKQLCLLLGSVIVLALSFGAIYQLSLFPQLPFWQNIAAINGFLALIVLIFRKRLQRDPVAFIEIGSRRYSWKVLLLPSLVILLGTGVLALSSSLVGGAVKEEIAASFLIAVFLIPLVEEIVFRMGVGTYFQRLAPGMWGAYFSALLFAWVHSSPNMLQLTRFEFGIPIGPFLLGLCCEYMYYKSKRLLPIYLFHMVCNGTVVIFRTLDARWLDWLHWFYL